ncbi:hypothetical protein LTR67_009812 [Exophiala xenobiotica]
MAFQSDADNHLIYFLLSLSALHLQTHSPDDQAVGLASAHYLNLGLQKFNVMLSKLNQENSTLLFVSSILIAIHVLVSRQQMRIWDLYCVPSSWFRTMQGIRNVVSAARPWIRNSKLEPLLLDFQFPIDGGPMGNNASGPFMELLSGLEDSDLDVESTAAYRYAVEYLQWAYTLDHVGEEKHVVRRVVLAFAVTVPPKFVSLLESNDPRTLVVTAHYFGMIASVDELLWLQGVAEQEITGLLTIVPNGWRWVMEWPLRQIQRHGLELSSYYTIVDFDRSRDVTVYGGPRPFYLSTNHISSKHTSTIHYLSYTSCFISTRLIQASLASLALTDNLASGASSANPCHAPGHTCNSVCTPHSHSLLAYATASSLKTSAAPTSINASGRPPKSVTREGAA